MGERKNVYVLDSITIRPKANEVVSILRNYSKDNPCPSAKIAEETGLTKGQVSKTIKYMRRCSEQNLDRYIAFYPISSKKGYFFPHSWDDFIECYITLQSWANSLDRTIKPMRKKMEKEGINWKSYIDEEHHEFEGTYFDELDEINKDTAWYLDKED